MTETDEYRAFVRGIAENPHDVLRRLVFADYLEENAGRERCGHCPERPGFVRRPADTGWDDCGHCRAGGYVGDGWEAMAEFIRLQCEAGQSPVAAEAARRRILDIVDPVGGPKREMAGWFAGFDTLTHEALGSLFVGKAGGSPRWNVRCVVRNGFVEEVECGLSCWFDQTCGVCDGSGGSFGELWAGENKCAYCDGGSSYACGPEVVASNPILKVVVTDRSPDLIGGEVCWIEYREGLPLDSNTLPTAVFDSLRGGRSERAGGEWRERFGYADRWEIYPTLEAANAALSEALIAMAREVAFA